MKSPFFLAVDQGTTSSRAMIFDSDFEVVGCAQQEFPQSYPHNGWVEQQPEDILQTTLAVCREVLKQHEGEAPVAMGITNQRETTIVWDRHTGKPVYPAIVWQDRRTAAFCRALVDRGLEAVIRNKTGLVPDPYFSAGKLAWILDQEPQGREKAARGDWLFGTVDCFLIWHFTEGRVHATDAGNASRTQLFNIHDQSWDEDLLEIFNIPRACLPEVRDTCADYGNASLLNNIPIRAAVGDQQAALIGQACFESGQAKSTYGTGCFLLANTGHDAKISDKGLLTTVAYRFNGKTVYGLEGSIFTAGAAVKWLRDGLGILQHAADTEAMANALDDNHGVYLVPAFTGMGAPYWQPNARAAVIGMSLDTGPRHMARAVLEAAAYQTHDLLEAVCDAGLSLTELKIDGGMSANDWLAQFLADTITLPVKRAANPETTALGAAVSAALGQGHLKEPGEWARKCRPGKSFQPNMDLERRKTNLAGWQRAVKATMGAQ